MARRGLNNFRRIETFHNGYPCWKLETLNGTPVPAFDAFCKRNAAFALAHSTQKRYAEATARFIDYLCETQVLSEFVNASHLNKVIDAYPLLLRDGSEITTARIRECNTDLWLAEVAESLDWAPLAPKSLDNTLPPVNKFLRLSESLAKESSEKAIRLGIMSIETYTPLINSVTGVDLLSRFEIAEMKQNTMFGNVARYAQTGIKRARGIKSNNRHASQSNNNLDFPRISLGALIEKATSWRDKALWLMLGATGIRTSEALNLLLDDIDLEAQRVYVFDPKKRRAQMGESHPLRSRFKGRKMAYTYLIPELRQDLFFALENYLKFEFSPCHSVGEPAYLFQYIDSKHRGKPYVDASASTISQSFKRAIKAANISIPIGERSWTPHSLRHMYGVYMVNDYPVNPELDQYGLTLVEVQMMMGHFSIKTTAHYARSKRRRLEEKLEASDRVLLGMSTNALKALPGFNIKQDRKVND